MPTATKEKPTALTDVTLEPAAMGPLSGDPSATVHARMLAVMTELPPIGKTEYNEQQKFHFRGHDAVLNALNPLLAKHGVFVLPEVLERVSEQRATSRGSTMYEVNLHIRFTFYGLAGDSVTASTWGEGTDMGDKATNKAMTMAFKAVLAQAFAVSTAEFADTDAGAPEETTRGGGGRAAPTPRPAAEPKVKAAKSWKEWTERMAALGVPAHDSAEWLRQVSAGIDLTADTNKNAMWQNANRVLVAVTELDADLGLTGSDKAREVLQKVFAEAFGGLAVEGPAWRISPSEADRPNHAEVAAAPAPADPDGNENAEGPSVHPEGYDPEIGF